MLLEIYQKEYTYDALTPELQKETTDHVKVCLVLV